VDNCALMVGIQCKNLRELYAGLFELLQAK
jgi:hypothetical protein